MSRPGIDRSALGTLLGEEIVDLSSRPSEDRSTHALSSLRVVTASGRELELVLKGTRTSRARGEFLRPRLVRDETRETWAYRSLLDPDAIDSARCYGVLDAGEVGERLVLESLPGRPLTEAGDPEAWFAAARWLARFHAWGAGRIGGARNRDRLLAQSAGLHARWLRRALRRAAAEGRDDVTAELERLEPAHAIATRRLARTRHGLVHGEFYPSNIVVQGRGHRPRVRVVDWESIGLGPVLLDLAALTTGDWSETDRAAIWGVYEEATGRGPGDLAGDLHAARLVNAVQWLGWSAGWRPPAEHDVDWVAEAREAAGGLAADARPEAAGANNLSVP